MSIIHCFGNETMYDDFPVNCILRISSLVPIPRIVFTIIYSYSKLLYSNTWCAKTIRTNNLIILTLDSILKIKHTLDALFEIGVSKHLPKEIKITYSKRTGRIQHVYKNENLLCTLRIDGGLAITPYFAQLLLKN